MEYQKLYSIAKRKIEKLLGTYAICKIGRSSGDNDILSRPIYKDYYFAKKIVSSKNFKVIKKLEKDLIRLFKLEIENEIEGGGSRGNSGFYWIYVAYK